MKFKRRGQIKRTKIEIIPMVDTMFFLLVFFMLSSLALSKLVAMPVDLPKAGSSQKVQDNQNIALSIDAAGSISIDRLPVQSANLAAKLREAIGTRNSSELTLVINADTRASHGLVVECIDVARLAGVAKFAIATQPKS
jgi:biopolymer transport protein ExbD